MNTISNWTDKELQTFQEWLVGVLKQNAATIIFKKVDGSERTMHCTLQPDLLPKTELREDSTQRKKPEGVLSVYDITASSWKSFKIKNVISVHLTMGE
jgi:hypothetical protein